MSDLIKIKEASYIEKYKIKITFNDLKTQVIDFETFLSKSKNKQINKYLDIELFKSFQVVDGDLDWNDFDLCFPIYDLYENSVNKFSSETKRVG